MLIEEKDNQKQDIVSIKNCFAYHKVINKNGQQEYVFLKANQSFKKLVNLAEKDLTGKKLVEIVADNKLSFNWSKLYNRVLLRDGQLRFTTYISRKDSWYEVVIYKLSNQQLMTTFTNISETKRSYQQKIIKQKFDKEVLNALNNHIVVINQAGVIEYANKVWKDFARKNNISPQKVSEGSNYLAAIKKENNNSAKKIFNQLEAIINGELDSFQQKYSCHSPEQKSWFKMYAKKIQIFKQRKIVIVHEEITKRELSRQKIRKQAKLRKLINRLSTLFINLSLAEINQGINYSLKQMGEFIAADRCYIVLFNSEYTAVDNSYLWSKVEESCLADKLEDINSENYPWLMEKLFDFNKIRITKLEDLPPEAKNLKQLLLKVNVKSVLIVAIIYDNNLLGFIAFDSITEQRIWSQEAISLLQISGELFAAVLKRRETEQRLADYTAEVEEANMELEYISDKLQKQIIKAQKLHKQFLPSKLPKIGDLKLAAYYQPAENLGGDFYNVIQYQNKLLFYIVDITGHGLDGAMLNIFIRESINSFLLAKPKSSNDLSPKAIIEFIYQRYCQEDFPDDYFICTILGVVDLENLEVNLVNAGIQVPALLTDGTGNIIELDSDAPPISGVIEKEFFAEKNLSQKKISFAPGNSLLLATDGLIEEEAQGEIYGESRLKEVLRENYFIEPEIKLEAIKQDFVSFAGDLEAKDDITLFILEQKAIVKDCFSKKINSTLKQGYQLLTEMAKFIKKYCEDSISIQIGVKEMLINAIEHGNKLDRDKSVELKIEVMNDYLRISIKDEGPGFEWYNKVEQKFLIKKEFERFNDRGRGIKIANKIFDSIYYNQQGNQVYLVKFI